MKAALDCYATGIILAHNHPSGNLQQSRPDEEITQKIKGAAGLFDIKVVDHIIITPEGKYMSFADEGIL